jgi:hypothetical protein
MNSSAKGRNGAQKKNIFLSYRKKDSESITRHLCLDLEKSFSKEQIFMDMDKLDPGVEFEEVIKERLADCDVMLAIIGPDWLGQKADGSSRIMDKKDWVRIELATALERKIRVIPVLVEGGRLPAEEQLPEDLRPLVGKQTYEVTNQRWNYDTDQLIQFLKKLLGEEPAVAKPASRGSKKALWITVAVAGLAVVFFLVRMLGNHATSQDQTMVQNATSTVDSTTADSTTGGKEQGTATIGANDVQGNWYNQENPDTTSYYSFTQDENTFLVKQYVNGYEEGSGKGTVNGKTVVFTLKTTKNGTTTTNAILSADGKELKGETIIDYEGSSYTVPFKLVREEN